MPYPACSSDRDDLTQRDLRAEQNMDKAVEQAGQHLWQEWRQQGLSGWLGQDGFFHLFEEHIRHHDRGIDFILSPTVERDFPRLTQGANRFLEILNEYIPKMK